VRTIVGFVQYRRESFYVGCNFFHGKDVSSLELDDTTPLVVVIRGSVTTRVVALLISILSAKKSKPAWHQSI